MMSPQDWMDRKIRETESIIKDTKEQLSVLDIPDYVQSLQISSFKRRLEDLKKVKKEIERVSNREEMVLTMHSPNLPSGKISVRAFTSVLSGLQNLSDSIANTLFNQPSEKGKIPQDILEQNEFILRETKAGSFKAVLEVKHPEQHTLDEPMQSQIIGELFKLLESSDVPDQLAELISQLGPRTLKNYIEWTKSIKELNTSIELEWTSLYRSPSRISLNVEKAERIFKTLSDFSNTTETEIKIIGRLTGANIRIKNFEIVTDEGEKITGRISKDALKKIENLGLNKKCEADLLKVTVIGPANREKVSWTLRDIRLLS